MINFPQYAPRDGYWLNDVFSNLTFDQPVSLRTPPGETNRLFVVERAGRIMVITNLAAPTKSVFLEITNSVVVNDIESGLLGMAFHPGFATNGTFFVYRTANLSSPELRPGFYNVLSRFQVSATNPNRAELESEVRVLAQLDAHTQHNGGDLSFGPDGYLYISVGDDGPAGEDVSSNEQAIDKGLFGGILRIDVDKKAGNLSPNPHLGVTSNYLIPHDNPFVDISSYQGISVDPNEVRTEFFAIGLRNPWRMTFHPVSGALLVGDVGNGLMEEVNVVKMGGNYGWPYYEGDIRTEYLPLAPAGFTHSPPVAKYWHGGSSNEGNCIIGGVFYFGDKIPQLKGQYVFGDYKRGHIWSLRNDGLQFSSEPVRLIASPHLTSFGNDPRDGEVLISNLETGKLLKISYTAPESAPTFPLTLKDTGVFADLATLAPAAGIIPYEINHPFWSDNALKRRWFFLGQTSEAISFDDSGYGVFPTGAVFVKHFDMEMKVGDPTSRRRLETRFIVKTNGGVYGVTYRWDAAGTNATLVSEGGENETFQVDDGGTMRTQTWRFPSRAECRLCHTDGGGQVLGFNIAQLNKTTVNGASTNNQLEILRQAGYVRLNSTNYTTLPALAPREDPNRSVHARAKSFLQANCSFCHYGPNLNAAWDARYSTPVSKMNIGHLLSFDTGLPNRLQDTGILKMPPIARAVVDTNGIELLKAWITALPKEPWIDQDIGMLGQEGFSTLEQTRTIVAGSGTGPIASRTDTARLLALQVTNNFTATARLVSQGSLDGGAGLMVRGNSNPDSTFAFQGRTTDGNSLLAFRQQTANTGNILPAIQASKTSWYRLTREGEKIIAQASEDGTNWLLRTSFLINLPETALVGLSSFSRDDSVLNRAIFDQFSVVSAKLDQPAEGMTFEIGQPVLLEATGFTYPTNANVVEFYANENLLARVTNSAATFWWTNAAPGDHRIVARVIDSSQTFAISEARRIRVDSLPANASIQSVTAGALGTWKNVLGFQGHLIPQAGTNFGAAVRVEAPNAPTFTWQNPSYDPRAVGLPSRNSATANGWTGPQLTVKVVPGDSRARQLKLYFVDWNNTGVEQRVEFQRSDDGTILASTTFSNFAGGLQLSARFIGEIDVVISATGGGNAILTAAFLDEDTASTPAVSVRSPQNGVEIVAPGPVVFEADVGVETQIETVSFFVDNVAVAEISAPPYRFVWNNPSLGEHTVFARASDGFGLFGTSSLANFSVTNPRASAAFIYSDGFTKGNWMEGYGRAGYSIPYRALSLPPYATVHSSATPYWRDFANLDNEKALPTEDGVARYVAYWVNQITMTNVIHFTDGKPHLFSIYFLDWDNQGWEVNVRIKDAHGTVLDERPVSNFNEGLYLTWSIRGLVTMEIERVFGVAAVCGFFIDDIPATAAQVQLVAPQDGAVFTSGQDVLLSATVPAIAESGVRQVDFHAGDQFLGSALQPPYALRWFPTTGDSALSARVILANGVMADSAPVTVEIRRAEIAAAVRFAGVNELARGDWRGKFGSNGHIIPLHSTNLPRFFDVTFSTNTRQHAFSWETDDLRGLQSLFAPTRVATAMYDNDPFETSFTVGDEKWRRLTFYFADWDTTTRAQRIDLIDAADGVILDSRPLESYSEGKYLTWLVRGNVIARFTPTHGNSLMNALFIDPVSNLEQWRFTHFGGFSPEDFWLAEDESDPENDGVANILEFKFGLNPFDNDSRQMIKPLRINGKYHLEMLLNPRANDVPLRFEISTDLKNWHASDGRFILREFEPGQILDRKRWEIETDDRDIFVRFRVY